jgi:uncharacterized membrane protein YoaK (UPF0700 family)
MSNQSLGDPALSGEQSDPQLHEQAALAVLLAFVSGYVDAYVFIHYQTYASFMSGNTTQTGLQLGQAHFATALHDFLPIPPFVIGVFLGTLLLQSLWSRREAWLFLAVAGLLVLAAIWNALDKQALWQQIVMLSLAMGLMNTSISKVGRQSISLGYVTGTLNNMAQQFALGLKTIYLSKFQSFWNDHLRRASFLGSIWLAFLIGALIATIASSQLAHEALLLPIVILIILVFIKDKL